MADSDSFKCPKCNDEHTIAELELYDVYEDSAVTDIDCPSCGESIVIISYVTGWQFKTETAEEFHGA